jgi:arylsulfatase A
MKPCLRIAAWACLLTGAFPALPAPAADTAAPAKPNIILILSDDVGLGDIGSSGGPFKTPHIDSLARGGIRFEQCYSTPLCGPSRCQLLTGRYPFRTGLISNQSQEAIHPDREVMIPTVLKKAGYVTASCGKWGQMPLGPGEWGFNEYLVFPGSGRYWREQTKSYRLNGESKDLPEGTYLPDLMHTFVMDFITKHKDQPFFLYYPMSHIHGPIVRTPDSKPGASKDELYIDNVAYMDKLVGKLLEGLDGLSLREKTLVLFTGDNGTARFGVTAATVQGRAISGQKGTMLEGGSRVPLLASWKGTTPEGRVVKDMVDFSDFFATLAELAGAPLPEGVKLDSRSFAPQLRGEPGTPREWVYVELNGKRYVRDARWKLTGDGQMFDLSEAPFTEAPVAGDTTDEKAVAARKHLQEILQGLVPPGAAAGATDPPATPVRKKGRRNR